MGNNTAAAYNGTEIYTSDILRLADEYMDHELDEKRREDIYNNPSIFMSMILYISDNIVKPDNNDIELLDNIFNIYIRLCTKYNMLPTLECFSILIKVNPGTLSDWGSGALRSNVYYDFKGNYIKDFPAWRLNHQNEQYRAEPSTAHAEAVKKWKNICKNFLINSLQNSRGTDANKIFIAKAAYGMVETAPIPVQNREQHRTAEQIAADYGPQEALPGDVEPDF
ncbi:MAG TPA: hypothetical protein H9742_14080 [Candidatus Acetatifactor stercoripullorum]|uniref:Uncharacterized protein n=1 Tax=Candidatus Acetatifactor stercoripullorum TaxID=2838414 RepID=A0A9D1R6I7_9FIRM|nr:hypothetical protein [Candidatus Acetatifactor stercoripullorum]